jgi:hypothetical protein
MHLYEQLADSDGANQHSCLELDSCEAIAQSAAGDGRSAQIGLVHRRDVDNITPALRLPDRFHSS